MSDPVRPINHISSLLSFKVIGIGIMQSCMAVCSPGLDYVATYYVATTVYIRTLVS